MPGDIHLELETIRKLAVDISDLRNSLGADLSNNLLSNSSDQFDFSPINIKWRESKIALLESLTVISDIFNKIVDENIEVDNQLCYNLK